MRRWPQRTGRFPAPSRSAVKSAQAFTWDRYHRQRCSADIIGVEAGLAGRIVKMAEEEQVHRHALERTGQQEAFTLLKRGQMIGALLLLALLSAGTALAMTGHLVTGFVTIGTAIVGAVISTYRNQRARSGNDDDGTAEDRLPDGADNGSRQKNLPSGGTKARPPKKDQGNKRVKRRSGKGKSKRGA